MFKFTTVSSVGQSRKSLLQRNKLEVTLLTHRSYTSWGTSLDRRQKPGYHPRVLSLCHMRSACQVLEASLAVYRWGGGVHSRRAGRKKKRSEKL